MKCQCEYGTKTLPRTSDIPQGECFRWYPTGVYPFMRVAGGFCNLETGDSKPLSFDPDKPVVRIRIDRVEDGVAVFVDA
jgi:hypothetical protein